MICLDATAPLLEPRRLEVRLGELREGGIDAALATVSSIENSAFVVRALAKWHALARPRTHAFRIAESVADIGAAKKAGEVAIVLHLQGGAPIEDDLDLLDVYRLLGVGVVQLTYNYRNLIGDGCLESVDGGLSDFGRRVVERLDDLHVVVDVSHGGSRTSLEAVEAARGPVVATHANARAVCDTPRNLRDDLIRKLAESGGVIGLCAFPAFVTRDERPTLDHLLDHAVHIADLVGAQHVGIGLDFAQEDEDDYEYYGYDERWYPRPPWVFPEGIRSFADFRNIGPALATRGFSEDEVEGILGGNFLRVFEQVWGG